MDTTKFTTRRTLGAIAKWGLGAALWAGAAFLFAAQWFAYDASRGGTDSFYFYLWWSFYIWGIVTPLVLLLARRYPIDSQTWKRAIPLHIVASVALTIVGLSAETYLGWITHDRAFSLSVGLRHYFTQHAQLSLITYWGLLTSFHVYRIYDQARKREIRAAHLEARLAEAQLNVLRMQLQPHFLFNTLQAATTLIHEDPDAAEDILLRLSDLLRVSLDQLHVQEVPLRREIEFLESYIGIQQRRFGDRIRFELRIDQDSLACLVPTLVLQPLVENAVRHGIGKHRESDVVSVRAFREASRLHIEVSNTSSVLAGPPELLLTRGTGLLNTQARLRQLYDDRQSLQLFNLSPRGVCVSLLLPFRTVPEDSPALVESHA